MQRMTTMYTPIVRQTDRQTDERTSWQRTHRVLKRISIAEKLRRESGKTERKRVNATECIYMLLLATAAAADVASMTASVTQL